MKTLISENKNKENAQENFSSEKTDFIKQILIADILSRKIQNEVESYFEKALYRFSKRIQ